MNQKTMLSSFIAATCAVAISPAAFAGGHTWRISEVFSTPDGLIQFIELRESFNGQFETNLGSTSCTSTGFSVPGASLAQPTTGRHYLIATQSFADLPGAPAPDRIIPANMIPFFNDSGDTIVHSSWDSWTFGALPTDCISSLHKGLPPNFPVTTGLNTPTNYAGQTATGIDACITPCVGDTDGNGAVDADDLTTVILGWGPCGTPCPGDVDGNDSVDADDLTAVILNWGPCK
jgi:hypothetical protein